MEEKIYTVGLFGNPELVIKNDNTICYYHMIKSVKYMLECNLTSKSAKLFKRGLDDEIFEEIKEKEIAKSVVKQLSNDGSRWEGDWFNEQPFGFGSVYDGEGNRMYSGFMFDGKKVGFGEEYFADTHTIDYCGNFLNNKRHGWGSTYDRNGNKLFEGDWRCGKNDFEEDRIEIKNEEDCLEIHDLIKELEIGEECFNKWKCDLVIENYPNLEKIVVKKNSLRNLNSLKICNNEKLKTIEIEDNEDGRKSAFKNVKALTIESIFSNIFKESISF